MLKPWANASDALLDVGLDELLVDRGVVLIGQQDHDDIRTLDRVGELGHLDAGLLRLVPRSAALAQPDGDLDPRFLQVQSMRVALRAVADDGDLLSLDERKVRVLVVVNLHGSP
jgi:hypothetical protein